MDHGRPTILFDHDGTLANSYPPLFKWFQHLCTARNKQFPYATYRDLLPHHRDPIYPNMYEFLGFDWNEDGADIREMYAAYPFEMPELFPGVHDSISTLYSRGFALGVASSNIYQRVSSQLTHLSLSSFFQEIVGSDSPGIPLVNGYPPLKPNPAVIYRAVERLQSNPAFTIYVGDHENDIFAARNVAERYGHSLPVIAVSYGMCAREKLARHRPDALVDSPRDLLPAIEEILQKH